jgi:hypothetical protein
MFRAAEVARLAHLAGIVAAVLAEHNSPEHSTAAS